MTAATLVRFRRADPPVAAYFAVHASEAGAVIASMSAVGVDVEAVPWDTLPGVQQAVTDAVAGRRGGDPAEVYSIGTEVAGRWTLWCPPVPAPAVPPGTTPRLAEPRARRRRPAWLGGR